MGVIKAQPQENGNKIQLQLCPKNGSINFNMPTPQEKVSSDEKEMDKQHKEQDELKMCLVCKTNEGKSMLNNYNSILKTCFGVTVSNPSSMICDRCAQLVLTTSEFRMVIRDVIAENTSAVGPQNVVDKNVKEEHVANNKKDDISYYINPYFDSKPAQKIKNNNQRRVLKSGTRILAQCDFCKHKYPRIIQDVDGTVASFVCPRCKHQPLTESNLQCDQCHSVVPASAMRTHLDMHAADSKLYSRCRLRTLQEPFSKTRTKSLLKEIPEKSSKREQRYENSFHCNICGKYLPCVELFQKHMKAHKDVNFHECKICGRIFKSQHTFERHGRIHGPSSIGIK